MNHLSCTTCTDMAQSAPLLSFSLGAFVCSCVHLLARRWFVHDGLSFSSWKTNKTTVNDQRKDSSHEKKEVSFKGVG